MKSFLAIAILVSAAASHKLHHQAMTQVHGIDDDIDSLMDKYDSQDKKPQAMAAAPAKTAPVKSGPSAAQITDMEFQILSGQYTATASTKADEDDEFQEILEKAATQKGQDKVLTKDNATDAATELMEQRHKAETMD